MGRNNDFEKWQEIYIDQDTGMAWNEIVVKSKTSKQTICKAIKFYKTLERIEIENKQYQYLIKTQNITKMLESMNNLKKMRLILILLIYNELSLINSSKKLCVSKSIVSRHLKTSSNNYNTCKFK